MSEPSALRIAMGSLGVLPIVTPAWTVLDAARRGFRHAPSVSALFAIAVGLVYAGYWLLAQSMRARRRLAVAAAPLALAAVIGPGASGGVFLVWAYLAVMVGYAAAARVVIPAVATVAVAAVIGIAATRTGDGSPSGITFLGFEATLAVCLSGAAAQAIAQLQRSNTALRHAESRIRQLATDAERARLGRDLHDLLGHSLSLIGVKLQVLRHVLDDPRRAAVELAEIDDLARRALQETRQAVADYRQPTLAGEIAGARIACHACGVALDLVEGDTVFPPHLDAALAWSLREAMTNVIRHSGARSCRVRIWCDGATAHLEVCDDGKGAPESHIESGLRTLRERVSCLGGTLSAANQPHSGFALAVSLPAASERGAP